MTVLAKYQRLEAEAVFRPDPEAQSREAIVSIGDATLTITTLQGLHLAHWSLPAIRRLNPGIRPALYSPGDDAPETVEIADGQMIDAVEKVLRAIGRARARPGRLRGLIVAGVIAAFALAAVIWLPDALIRYTASLVPGPVRAEIGKDLLVQVRRVAGAPCADPTGLRALQRLEQRLFPGQTTRLLVMPSALTSTASIPGGTILFGRDLVEAGDTPDTLAGYLLAEDIRRSTRDPMVSLLRDAGLGAAVVMLTTGKLPASALARHAELMIARTPAPVSESRLLTRMREAGVPPGPYGTVREKAGEAASRLLAATASDGALPVLSDGNWLALRSICDG